MRPCQAAPAFDTTISTPPKFSAILCKGGAHRSRVGDIAAQRQARRRRGLWRAPARRFVDVEQRDFGAGRREGFGGGGADRAGRPGDRRDLPGERRFLGGAELCLFERPVFHIEHVGFGNRLEPPDRLRIRDGRDRGFGEIGGDPRVLLGAAEAEQAEARHQHDARQRIEHASCRRRSAHYCGRNSRV